MRRTPKESKHRATLTRNGIIAADLLVTDAKPPTQGREIEEESFSVARVLSRWMKEGGAEVEATYPEEPTANQATS
jgi:hypothetical protein